MKDKNITNRNTKGQRHGYQEFHWNGKLSLRTNYKNDKFIGYQEVYYSSEITIYYIR